MQISTHQLAKGTKFETPYYIIKGKSVGNTVMITAGLQEDETVNILEQKNCWIYDRRTFSTSKTEC